MTGKTHLSFALALYFVIPPNPVINPVVIGTASLLPDIDHPYSLISKTLGYHIPLKHREAMHSPFILLIISGILYLTAPSFIPAVLLGFGSHLFLDMFNPTGIPILIPFTHKKFRIARIYSGSFIDDILFFVFSFITAYFFLTQYIMK